MFFRKEAKILDTEEKKKLKQKTNKIYEKLKIKKGKHEKKWKL